MKKSIICIIIVLTVVLTGCVENQASSQNEIKETYLSRSQKYGYFSMFGVTWGMDFEECVQAMGLKEKDFKKEEEIDGSAKEIRYITPVKIRGKDADFVLSFDEQYNEIGLQVIRIGFKEKVSIDFVEEEFNKEVELRKLSYKKELNPSWITYKNEKNINNIENQNIQKKVDELLKTIDPFPFLMEPNKLDGEIPVYPLENFKIIKNPEDEEYVWCIMMEGRFAALVDYADNEVYGENSSDK